MAGGVNYIGDNNPEGMSFGSSTSELISFYGVTPVAQQSGANQSAVSTAAMTAAATTAAVSAVMARTLAVVDLANQLRSDLVDLGLIKGSA